MFRDNLAKEESAATAGLRPPESGRHTRPAGDNWRFLNGMLHVFRIGCPWRDIHERYGKWNSVHVRFRRWAEQGVWGALPQTLVYLGLTDEFIFAGPMLSERRLKPLMPIETTQTIPCRSRLLSTCRKPSSKMHIMIKGEARKLTKPAIDQKRRYSQNAPFSRILRPEISA